MKTIACIPARYAATRFPGKLMQEIDGKSIIRRVYENTRATLLFDEVIVVTDSEIIFNEIIQHGGYALMSKRDHESGSDRIAEAVEDLEVDIVVNVQGDEPFLAKDDLRNLLKVFEEDKDQKIGVASLMFPISSDEEVRNPNHVKVVVDKGCKALYFSRSPVPYPRNPDITIQYWKHIGIYAFRKEALMSFTKWPAGILESIEKLEQLRYLENGIQIKMVTTNNAPISIDTPEDLAKAIEFYRYNN